MGRGRGKELRVENLSRLIRKPGLTDRLKTRDVSPARALQNSPGRKPWEQRANQAEHCKGGADACTAHAGLAYRAWSIAPGLTPRAVLPGPFRADGNTSPAKRVFSDNPDSPDVLGWTFQRPAAGKDLTQIIRLFYSYVCFKQSLVKMKHRKSTRERVLDAAERLFAERGFDGTSLRAITSEAGVNLAAVNYHFKSKNDLIHEVFSRRLAPINTQRLAMLDACEVKAGSGVVPLEKVVRAFVEPLLRPEGVLATGRVTLQTLLGRMYADPGRNVRRIFLGEMEEAVRRFRAAFQRALPEVPPADLFWRLHFTIGAMAHTLAASWIIEMLSGGLCDPSDADGTIERLVTFAVSGLKSPLPPRACGKRARSSRPSSPRRALAGREAL